VISPLACMSCRSLSGFLGILSFVLRKLGGEEMILHLKDLFFEGTFLGSLDGSVSNMVVPPGNVLR